MKKIISLLLIFCMLFSAVALTSCGEKEGPAVVTTTKTTEPKPTDPIEILRDTFSEENIYEKISDVKKPVEDVKSKVDDIKAVKMTNSIAINKLVVGGNAILPSPLVLSGEIKTDKKALSLDGKLSFLGEDINASVYASTKSGKGLDDDTLEADDITVFADLGDLYKGYIGFDDMIKSAVENAKEKADDVGSGKIDTSKLEEAVGEMKDLLDKYFSEEQTRKIAADFSSAVEKAIDAIPESAIEKSTGALTYKDVYTAEGAKISTITIDNNVASKIIVAFFTQLNNSTSEFVKKVKENADWDGAIKAAEKFGKSDEEGTFVLTITTNDEALYVKGVSKKADAENTLFEAFCKKDNALYFNTFGNDGVADAEAKAVKTDSKFELSFKLLKDKKLEFNANIEKKDEDNYTFAASVNAGQGDENGTIGISGSISKTGDLKNGSVSGGITFSVDIPSVKAEMPISFKIERNDKKAAVEFKIAANATDMIDAEIEVKADVEILDGVEMIVPAATDIKQIGSDNTLEFISSIMGNLYQKCPNITLFLAQMSSGSNDNGDDWE